MPFTTRKSSGALMVAWLAALVFSAACDTAAPTAPSAPEVIRWVTLPPGSVTYTRDFSDGIIYEPGLEFQPELQFSWTQDGEVRYVGVRNDQLSKNISWDPVQGVLVTTTPVQLPADMEIRVSAFDGAKSVPGEHLSALVGRIITLNGQVLTDVRPGGAALIGGPAGYDSHALFELH